MSIKFQVASFRSQQSCAYDRCTRNKTLTVPFLPLLQDNIAIVIDPRNMHQGVWVQQVLRTVYSRCKPDVCTHKNVLDLFLVCFLVEGNLPAPALISRGWSVTRRPPLESRALLRRVSLKGHLGMAPIERWRRNRLQFLTRSVTQQRTENTGGGRRRRTDGGRLISIYFQLTESVRRKEEEEERLCRRRRRPRSRR